METHNDETTPIPCDDEGLRLSYDVIICGTGLVQSILASALARAGKSVLHCDSQGYYGELEAVLSLPYIQQGQIWEDHSPTGSSASSAPTATATATSTSSTLESPLEGLELRKPCLQHHSTHSLDKFPLALGTSVQTPFGSGTIIKIETTKVDIALKSWVLSNGTWPTLSIGIPQDLTSHSDDETPVDYYLQTYCRIQPSILLQAQQLLQHNPRSFAIDVTPLLIYGSGEAVSGFIASRVSEYVDFKPIEGMLWLDCTGQTQLSGNLSQVPCSKGDVFETKLLNPLEKRKLMKFLHLMMDFIVYKQAEEAKEDIEAEAPQMVQSINERQLNQGRSLSRPANKAVKLDDLEALKEAMEHNRIDLETYLRENQKFSPALASLVRFALALETTSNPEPIRDGITRLCQHLQGLGKFGPTAFLVPMYGSGEFSQAFCRSAAVHGATYLLRREPTRVNVADGSVVSVVIRGPVETSGDKTVACTNVILPANATGNAPSRHLLRRVSIVSNNIVNKKPDAQRHIIVIPPSSTLGNENAIHGLLLDYSVQVAPPNCTLLHLTTTTIGDVDVSILDRATNAILPADSVELFHICFSYPLYADSGYPLVNGLHVCPQVGQALAADHAFIVAKEIFEKICPQVEFLELSAQMDFTIKENLAGREEEDEERDTLDKAAELLDASKLDTNKN